MRTMMTLNEMTNALNAHHGQKFGSDYAGFFDISMDEAERIAAASNSPNDFENIWATQDWWSDEAQK